LKKQIILLVSMLFAVAVFAKDKKYKEPPPPPPPHGDTLQVGIFVQASPVDEGAVTQKGYYGQSVTTARGYLQDIVDTPEGRWVFEEPTNSLGAWAQAMGSAEDAHNSWFVDDLHPGDKVLFRALLCNKRNQCTIRVPKPNKPDKDYVTSGTFHWEGEQAQSNIQALCGKGKLAPEVEAQVCPAAK
jgi:hypothetical protein